MMLRLGMKSGPLILVLATGLIPASHSAERPFAKEGNDLIRRLAIRAKDVRRSAEALGDLASRHEAFPLLTHRTRLTMLKEDVAKMRDIVFKLHDNRGSLDEWQVVLVERITPKWKSLSEDVDAALVLLDRGSQPMFAPTYRSLVGDIRDRVTGIVRTTDEFLFWAEREAKKR